MLSAILFSVIAGITPVKGSSNPYKELKRPHLTLAQGYIESKLNVREIGLCGEKGAWQVREEYWGKVPKGLLKQGKQAERIIDTLNKHGNAGLMKALSRYNGKGRKARRYAKLVRRHAFELALVIIPERSKIDVLT